MYRTLILIPMLLMALQSNEDCLYFNLIGFALIFLFSMWCKYTKIGKRYLKSIYKSLCLFNDRFFAFMDNLSK